MLSAVVFGLIVALSFFGEFSILFLDTAHKVKFSEHQNKLGIFYEIETAFYLIPATMRGLPH